MKKYFALIIGLFISFNIFARSEPIEIVIPYAAGGTTDIMARTLLPYLKNSLDEELVIVNKTGAAGSIAIRYVLEQPADGKRFIFLNNGNVAITPFLQKDPGYDVDSLDYVGLAALSPQVVMVNGKVPADTVTEYVSYAQERGEPIKYATAGVGSFGQLSTVIFGDLTGLDLIHVPYKGTAETGRAVGAGEVELLITTMSGTMKGLIDSGKIKVLGVAAETESVVAPGAPALASKDLPGYVQQVRFGFAAKKGTPKDAIDRFNAALRDALEDDEVRQKYLSFGQEAASSTPQEYSDWCHDDTKIFSEVIKKLDLDL